MEEKNQRKKKEGILKRFTPYMGNKKYLLHLALVFSGLSAILGILPLIYIWKAIQVLLEKGKAFEFTDISGYAVAIGAFAVSGIVSYFLALMCSHLAAFHLEVNLQKISLEKIMEKPLGFFDLHQSGSIRKIINDGAANTHAFLAHQFPDLAGTILSPIMLFVMILLVDWRLGLASLIPIVFSILIFGNMMSDTGQEYMQAYYDSLEKMSSEAVEYVRGIPVVKTFGQSIYSFKRFYESIMDYKKYVMGFTLLWKHPMSLSTVLIQSTAFFLVPMAIFLIERGEELSKVITNFIVYLLLAPNFMSLVMKAMFFRNYFSIAEQTMDRIDGLLFYRGLEQCEQAGNPRGHQLEFKNVSFTYEGGTKKAVDGVSFKVREGETVALVGPSGGGKTTIARLAARFWDVDEGEVLLGGVNVKAIEKEELMKSLSFVFQNTKLFSMSIRDNILLGKKDASEEEIKRAIRLSQSEDILQNLPQGINTVLGTKGTYLSGGEQQRISLARAFLKDAPLVLLDEATAFADPENEHLIQKALRELSKGKTSLIIAHRLTSVEKVDRILVISEGTIVEEGSHLELLEKDGLYKKMYEEYKGALTWKLTSSLGGSHV